VLKYQYKKVKLYDDCRVRNLIFRRIHNPGDILYSGVVWGGSGVSEVNSIILGKG
jgi:hypothetical protein